MTPQYYAPDPWPVDGPADLSDNEYTDALANIDSHYISNILGALNNIGTERVVVWLLFLGESYDAEGGTIRGYYIRSVVRNVQALRGELTPLGGITGVLRGTAGQLTLSLRMVPLAPEEDRRKVVGWGFAEL